MVRDLDLEAMNVQDGRRLEVIADGLPLYGGTPHISAANVDGLRLAAVRRRKKGTYPSSSRHGVAVVWLSWPLRSVVAGPRRRWCS